MKKMLVYGLVLLLGTVSIFAEGSMETSYYVETVGEVDHIDFDSLYKDIEKDLFGDYPLVGITTGLESINPEVTDVSNITGLAYKQVPIKGSFLEGIKSYYISLVNHEDNSVYIIKITLAVEGFPNTTSDFEPEEVVPYLKKLVKENK